MGARAILTADLVPTLVEKVKSEDDEIKVSRVRNFEIE